MDNMKELGRIKEVYQRRYQISVDYHIHSFFNLGNLYISQRRDWEIFKRLKQYGIFTLKDKKILDVGCGAGGDLINFIRYGAMPDNCFGIDLLPDRIERASSISPNIDFRWANAERLPYEDKSFDIVLMFTVFTSIFDSEVKKNIAKETLSVLKSDGIIIYFDFCFNNPKNKDVKGIKKREIYNLFDSCDLYLKRITLAPPLSRIMAPYSYLTCHVLEKLRVFNTHYLGLIRRSKK